MSYTLPREHHPVHMETTPKKYSAFDEVFVQCDGSVAEFREYISYERKPDGWDAVSWHGDGGRTPTSVAVPECANRAESEGTDHVLELVSYPQGGINVGHVTLLRAYFRMPTVESCTKYVSVETLKDLTVSQRKSVESTMMKIYGWCPRAGWRVAPIEHKDLLEDLELS